MAECVALLENPNIEESIKAALPYGEAERSVVIMDVLKEMALYEY
jgi:uncharacterized protein (UPF0262 family)